MRVFVDASAWAAMALPRDQSAPTVQRIMAELRQDTRAELVTTNWTLYEALAVTQRAGKAYAIDLHRRALRIANLVFVGLPTEKEALRRFLDWTDKTASVVDHANALVAEAARCDAILSFDADFIPLARMAGMGLLGVGPSSTSPARPRRPRSR